MRIFTNCSTCGKGFTPEEAVCSRCQDKAKAINESILLQPILRAAKEHFYGPDATFHLYGSCELCQAVSNYLTMLNNRRGEG